ATVQRLCEAGHRAEERPIQSQRSTLQAQRRRRLVRGGRAERLYRQGRAWRCARMSINTPSPRQGPTAADVVQLLQTAFPKAWERHLRNRLGATDPAELTPAELARFVDHVFWLVKQTGIRDPAAWLAFRAQRDATMAPVERGSPVEIGDIAAQRKSAEREPVALENSPATTSTASPPRPVARTVACGTTKAEVLSR